MSTLILPHYPRWLSSLRGPPPDLGLYTVVPAIAAGQAVLWAALWVSYLTPA